MYTFIGRHYYPDTYVGAGNGDHHLVAQLSRDGYWVPWVLRSAEIHSDWATQEASNAATAAREAEELARRESLGAEIDVKLTTVTEALGLERTHNTDSHFEYNVGNVGGFYGTKSYGHTNPTLKCVSRDYNISCNLNMASLTVQQITIMVQAILEAFAPKET